MPNVEITWDAFECLLDDRRNFWEGDGHRTIPDCVWEYAMDLLRECGGTGNPEYNDPRYIVDNLVVNGSWEDFDEVRKFREEYADAEDLAQALEDDGEAIAVFRSSGIVLWDLGF